ncbi:MAG: hypothetical protein ABSG82_01870 [Sedimentisphaerales bacterium]
MVGSVIFFVLRICLIGMIWAFVWLLVEPKTKPARVIRAALLVASLLVILVVIRTFGA